MDHFFQKKTPNILNIEYITLKPILWHIFSIGKRKILFPKCWQLPLCTKMITNFYFLHTFSILMFSYTDIQYFLNQKKLFHWKTSRKIQNSSSPASRLSPFPNTTVLYRLHMLNQSIIDWLALLIPISSVVLTLNMVAKCTFQPCHLITRKKF